MTYDKLGELSAWLALFAVLMLADAILGIGSERWVVTMMASGKWTTCTSLAVLAGRSIGRRCNLI